MMMVMMVMMVTMMVMMMVMMMAMMVMLTIPVYRALVCTHTASLMMMIPVAAPDRHTVARKTVTFPATCCIHLIVMMMMMMMVVV